jgi:hypothetical protein
MKKSTTIVSFIFLLLFCTQKTALTHQVNYNTNESPYIQFNEITFNYHGQTRKQAKPGKIIFEKERLIMQIENSKEAFYINEIKEAENILTFKTKNSKDENALFYIVFKNSKIRKVTINMYDMDGVLSLSKTIKATLFNLRELYNDKISACSCNSMQRADGAFIIYCEPLPVAFNNELELGLSLLKNNSVIFGALSLRFHDKIKHIIGDINIVLQNGVNIKASLINQQDNYIGDFEVLLAIYNLTEQNIGQLKQSEISTISFKLNDNINRTYEAKTNQDAFIKHLDCLRRN